MKGLSAEEAAGCLINFIGRYDEPEQIVCDKGSQFINDLFYYLKNSIGFTLDNVLSYSKEENGIVERANKEVLRHLLAFVMHRKMHKIWAKVLPLVQRIMNSTVHSALRVSPAQLLFGNNATQLERNMFKENPYRSKGDKRIDPCLIRKFPFRDPESDSSQVDR